MRIFEITLFGATFGPTWYGLMYALAFGAAWALLTWRGPFSKKQLDDLIFWGLVGVVLGGRLGYVLIYNLPYFLENPGEILMPWKGGMSFHGGLMGVITVMLVLARKWNMSFWRVADACAWVTPVGILLGRIGNYVNGELLGWKGYTGPLAVVRDGVSYFPTPLLEAGLEGILLFAVTSFAYFRWARSSSSLRGEECLGGIPSKGDVAIHAIPPGRTALLFMAGYAVARFTAEFFRDPDPQVGYLLWGWVTAGMGLSFLMIAIAAALAVWARPKSA